METELPKGWEKVKFSDVTECEDGKRIPLNKKQRSSIKGKYPYWGASGIVDYLNDYKFDGDYLLISEDGENLKSRKKPISYIATGKFWVNNHIHAMRIKECTNTRFLMYFFERLDLAPFISGSTRPKLNQKRLMNIPVILPSLKEQNRIVAKLDAFFKEYEILKQEREKVRVNHEKILQGAITKLLENIEGQKLPLSDLFEVRKEKKDPKRDKVSNYVGLEHIESKTRELLGHEKTPTIRSIKNVFYKGDILYGKLRPYLNKVCLAPFNGICSTDIIALKSREFVNTEFLLYLLNSNNVVEELSHLSYGLRMPRVAERHFKEIVVKVPSKSDQDRIVVNLRMIDGTVQEIKKLDEGVVIQVDLLHQSVLSKAFKGELVS